MAKKSVKSAEFDNSNPVILGVFEGECADSNITNLNGLDITREVWENVFESEEYKNAIEHGWYIGYLGHPEDPSCMDFKDACIVMTEGHIDDSGKVYGKFNLVDTPVGRVVKSFIDAGVTFGISVRGAGDIVDNSVDPETFVFRGFDLVSFPAFPESIPTFSEIAASQDVDKQKKYKIMCSALRDNIDQINNTSTIDILESHFAKQSDEYSILENRRCQLQSADDCDDNIDEQKVEAMTELYLQASTELKQKQQQLADLQKSYRLLKRVNSSDAKYYTRKLDSVNRIMSEQIADLDNKLSRVTASYKRISSRNRELTGQVSVISSQLSSYKKSNLKYRQKIDAANRVAISNDSKLHDLQSKLSETVESSKDLEAMSSNLDASNKELKNKLEASLKLVQQYQDAYANLYANACGVKVTNIEVTASTTVPELQQLISGNREISKPSSDYIEPTPMEFDDIDPSDLVTL